MSLPLPRLDAATDMTQAIRSPPKSPVRSYYDAKASPTAMGFEDDSRVGGSLSEAGGDRFTDWVPGMLGGANEDLRYLSPDSQSEVEATLANSPLARRAVGASPKGGLLLGPGDVPVLPEADEEGPAPVADMNGLEEEFRMFQEEQSAAVEEEGPQ